MLKDTVRAARWTLWKCVRLGHEKSWEDIARVDALNAPG
jgi:hypothetical protein